MWVPRKKWELIISKVNSLNDQVEKMGEFLGFPGYDELDLYWKKPEPDSIIVATRLMERAAAILKSISFEEKNP